MLQRLKWLRWRDTDKVRQGTGPRDNLVVLVWSLVLLTVIGGFFVFYYRSQSPQPGAATPQIEREKKG
jgi:hypothetical protein